MDLRFQSAAVLALQEAAETVSESYAPALSKLIDRIVQFLVKLFDDTNLAALHGKHVTM